MSVVVPCFNEEQVVEATHAKLIDVLGSVEDLELELIYVDDGSNDGTADILRRLSDADARVGVVLLSRNFGHQYALSAGLEVATGDAVVILDADLQDPPEVALEFLQQWRAGADVVVGVRVERRGEAAFKRVTAGMFYRTLNAVSDVPITNDAGDFRLLDRKVVDALNALPERDRFVRGLVSWLGYQQVHVPYVRAPRLAGTTKYPLLKMIRFGLDGFVSFSLAPLRVALLFGVATSVLAVLGMVYAVVSRLFTRNWVPGWTLLFIAVLFYGGVQLLALGVVGEYVGRVYAESKRRPLYVVREAVRPRQGSRKPDRTR